MLKEQMNIILIYNLRKYIKSVFQHIMQNKIQEVFRLFSSQVGYLLNAKVYVVLAQNSCLKHFIVFLCFIIGYIGLLFLISMIALSAMAAATRSVLWAKLYQAYTRKKGD